MRWSARWIVPLMVLALSSCFYVSKDEFVEAWDWDGDGFPNDADCAPEDPDIYPGAPDPRGDGCDSDCGNEADADGDDWPDDADCAPDDPTIFPCAIDDPLDTIDSDCDGSTEQRTTPCPAGDPRDMSVLPFESCDSMVSNPPQMASGL